MSVSDPLLKQLKDHIFDLRRHCLVLNIDDTNGLLLPFCSTLELIFRKGLHVQKNTPLGSLRRDYWNVFFAMLRLKRQDKLPLRLATSIQTVKDFKKVQTAQGKGRLLLRVLLKRRLLRTAVACLLESPGLIGVDKINFSITLRNATFLDETWHLGLYRSFAAGVPVVTQVEEGSVAGEDDKIQVGDVLDDLYGEALKGRKRGTISTLLDHFKGMPVYVSVIKSYQADGTPYPPVANLLKRLRLSPPHEKKAHSGFTDRNSPDLFPDSPGASGLPVNTPHESAAYAAVYIGKNIRWKCWSRFGDRKGHPGRHVQGGRHTCETQDTVLRRSLLLISILLEKHFTEIASCGKSSNFPGIFAVVAGETTCTVSKHFYSYVFQVKQMNICQTILCTIAEGFTRTSWSV
ncbi:hypothetical protein MTO96_033570 [Rhipicephalus appendiculatus]